MLVEVTLAEAFWEAYGIYVLFSAGVGTAGYYCWKQNEQTATLLHPENSVFKRPTPGRSANSLGAQVSERILNLVALEDHLAFSLVSDRELLPHLKGDRLLLHEVIAQVQLYVKFSDENALKRYVSSVYQQAKIRLDGVDYGALWDMADREYRQEFHSAKVREKIDHLRQRVWNKFHEWKLNKVPLATWFYFSKTMDQCIHFYKMVIGELYIEKVRDILSPVVKSIINTFGPALLHQRHELNRRLCFAVSGPIASGKSSSYQRIMAQHPTENFIFISLDQYGALLRGDGHFWSNPNSHEFFEYLKRNVFGQTPTPNYEQSKVPLAEAWLIGERFYELLAIQMQQGAAPHIIMEGMNPAKFKYAAARGGQFTVYANTARPEGSVERMHARGAREERYVCPLATLHSYKEVYLQFLQSIIKARKYYSEENVQIILQDTDLLYAIKKLPTEFQEPQKKFQLVTFNLRENKLTIHQLPPLLRCIERYCFMLDKQQNESTIWRNNPAHLQESIIKSLKPLFFEGVDIYYCAKKTTYDELSEISREILWPTGNIGTASQLL